MEPVRAVDFSQWQSVSPDAIKAAGIPDAFVYLNNGLPDQWYIDALKADGISVYGIDEPYDADVPTVATFNAGVARAQNAEARAASRGITGPITYVVHDGTSYVPQAQLNVILQHAAGIKAGSTRPSALAYGPAAAVMAAQAGAPGFFREFEPSTWGALPGQTAVVQEANEQSPVPNTDLDTVNVDLGGPSQELIMQNVYFGKTPFGVAAAATFFPDGQRLTWVADANDPPLDAFGGMPKSSADWANQTGRSVQWFLVDSTTIAGMISPPMAPAPGVDPAALAAKLVAALTPVISNNSVTVPLSAKQFEAIVHDEVKQFFAAAAAA